MRLMDTPTVVRKRFTVVEVYRLPGENGYGEKRTYRRGETIAPALLPDAALAVEQVLG